MIDIKLIRENPELVKENIKKKFQDEKLVLVDEVAELDKEFRAAKTRGDSLRASCRPQPSVQRDWRSDEGRKERRS